MRRFVFVICCALAFCISSEAVYAQNCSLKQIASLPITTTSSGKIAVPVKINGVDRMFAVMMNSAISGVNANFVEQQDLATESVSAGNVDTSLWAITASPNNAAFRFEDAEFTGGIATSISHSAVLPEFQVGALDVKNLKVSELPGWKNADGIVGILGTGILRHFDVELDFKNARLNLYSPDHCPGNVVYWAASYTVLPIQINNITGEITAQMSLDGKPLNVGFSSAPGNSEMSATDALSLFNISVYSPDLKPLAAFGDTSSEGFRYPFKTLSMDGFTIQNPTIDLLSIDPEPCAGTPYLSAKKAMSVVCRTDLTLKLAELRQLHLYFAFGEKNLYVTAADAHR